MSSQQDLFPPETQQPEISRDTRAMEPEHTPSPVWLQRLSVVILVVFCFYVGLLVFLLPWTRYWNNNHYLISWPWLGPVMNSGFTRGIVSGIGLLDFWIGVSEIIHYREYHA